jgi:hypothetical protein
MKILDAEFVFVNSVYFDFVVHLRYKTWFLGKEKLKTVFRSTREVYRSDFTPFRSKMESERQKISFFISYNAWYDAETNTLLPKNWCIELEKYYCEKPYREMLQAQAKEATRLSNEHKEEISKWVQQTSNKSK